MCVTLGEVMESETMTGQGGNISVSNLCVGGQNDELFEPDRGMKLNCPNNVNIVKDLCDENVAPSSVKCTFKRGTCLVHKLKGEKYTN